MKNIDQYPTYELGAALSHLRDVCHREKAHHFDQANALWSAEAHLHRLVTGEAFEISFSLNAAQQLLAEIQSLLAELRKEFTAENPKAVERWRTMSVRESVDKFEHQFSAELKKLATYAVPRRGIFDTARLVESADEQIPVGIRNAMSDMAKKEFRAAGRCLAFGLFSASGFHAMRSAECILREYYELFKGSPRDPKITMGQMAGDLDGWSKATRKGPKPNAATVRTIRDVADYDRNPLMHPNIVLGDDDALLLFDRALAIIVLMTKEMKESNETSTAANQDANGATVPLTRNAIQSKAG